MRLVEALIPDYMFACCILKVNEALRAPYLDSISRSERLAHMLARFEAPMVVKAATYEIVVVPDADYKGVRGAPRRKSYDSIVVHLACGFKVWMS